jgi:hypothetical protein
MRSALDKEKIKGRKKQLDKALEVSEKNEMEQLFVECIEEIRKDIMKRRLKQEI